MAVNPILLELLKVAIETAVTEAILHQDASDALLTSMIEEKNAKKNRLMQELGLL